MARFALDAPTLVRIVVDGVEVDPGHQLIAPNAIRTDALSLLFAAVTRGDMAESIALDHHQRMTELKMRLLGDRVSRRTAWTIAKEHGWRDLAIAEYLAVCRLQADALVTVDPEMVAKATGVVPLAPLSALTTS
jgi:hypothetical protein